LAARTSLGFGTHATSASSHAQGQQNLGMTDARPHFNAFATRTNLLSAPCRCDRRTPRQYTMGSLRWRRPREECLDFSCAVASGTSTRSSTASESATAPAPETAPRPQAPPRPQSSARDDPLLGTRDRRTDRSIGEGLRSGIAHESRHFSGSTTCSIADKYLKSAILRPWHSAVPVMATAATAAG
jgi:hypothetical protein